MIRYALRRQAGCSYERLTPLQSRRLRPMTLGPEIVEWSGTRPAWQRAVLGRLARGAVLGAEDYADIAERLITGGAESDAPVSEIDLGVGGLPGERVNLLSVEAVSNVNALVGGQKLTFGSIGLTVVYGDN